MARKYKTLSDVNTDSPDGDAFGRLRVSTPSYVFDSSFEYDLHPLLYDKTVSGTGAEITHDATNKTALLIFSDTSAGIARMQSYEFFRYQPGRSQLVFMTFNFNGFAENCTKYVGYSDGNNGIELQVLPNLVRIALLSDTVKGDEFINQEDWNIDRLDGTGSSGITLDITKTHILVIDFQWLGVGRIRVAFDIDGVVVPVHEFTHANIQTVPYMQTANLPVRAGMVSTDTATTTMRFICASVVSEGGQIAEQGYGYSIDVAGTAGNDTRTHIMSLRPRALFNGVTNRAKLSLESVEILVTGSSPVAWSLVLGQAITSPTWSNVSDSYSVAEITTAGAISGDPSVTLASGYIPASNQSKGVVSRQLTDRYPITLDASGNVRTNGTVTLIAFGLGASSALRASLTWKEIR